MRLRRSLLKYLALIFILNLWYSNVSAYQVNKTSGSADIKWFTSNVIYYINPSGGPSANLSAIQASMQTWTDVDTSYFAFVYGGTTTNTSYGTNDGVNIVCFGPMGLTGTLAGNTFWYYTSSGQIIDSDIKFNTEYTWATDGFPSAYDVQNVGTHEFGHSLSLADLYNAADSEKTMYGYASAGEIKKRTLDQDDIDGITYLYPDTIPPTGTITINSGASYTNSTSVTLTLSCTDFGSGCAQMQFSNDNTNWSTPEAYTTTKAWTLTSGDSTKTVYAKFKDNAGNWSGAYNDTIVLAIGVNLLSPNGGEVIPSGSTYTIQWLASPEAVKFDLMYSLNNGTTLVTIANNVTGNSYNWKVPKPLANKKRCFVKVIGYNASGIKVGEDTSDSTFTIEVVRLTSPNGGETLRSGNIHTITWTTNATKRPVAGVKLFYTINGGTTWAPIKTLTGNPGSYNWRVPNVSSSSCKVKVVLKDASGNKVGSDVSDNYFTI